MWPSSCADFLLRDQSLKDLTTVRVGGTARWLARPRDREELVALLQTLADDARAYRVLGGGSNLLPADGVLDDVVIHLKNLRGLCTEGERVFVEAGLPTSRLVAGCTDAGLEGAHVLAGIPGTVGGALVMNAGTRHGAIAELVESVDFLRPGGRRETLPVGDLAYGYRTSKLPPSAVVIGACLRLTKTQDPKALRTRVADLIREKNAVQPTSAWNFGCMFKNPAQESAGRLLDRAGVKGLAKGGARISPVHANFVENLGEATAEDIHWLLRAAEKAALTLGVELSREVRTWEF